jgi:hypothetical protein
MGDDGGISGEVAEILPTPPFGHPSWEGIFYLVDIVFWFPLLVKKWDGTGERSQWKSR